MSRAGKGRKVGNGAFEIASTTTNESAPLPEPMSLQQDERKPLSPELQDAFTSTTQAFSEPSKPELTPPEPAGLPRRYSPSQFEPLPILHPNFSPSDFDLPPLLSSSPQSHRHLEDVRSHSLYPTGSPKLVDILLPGTDLRQPPDLSEPRPPMSPLPYQPGLAQHVGSPEPASRDEEGFDEEIVRDPTPHQFINDMSPIWMPRLPSPAPSNSSSTSSRSTDFTLFRPPRLEPQSPEMLMCRFVQETCAILSVKDGPTENPWRTLVLEMGQGCEALSHAISSMSALHGATRNVQLRSAGIGHMNKSIRRLSSEIQSMRLDQALATSLALALGEGWDEKISTGIVHLKGAKELLYKALMEQNQNMERGQLTRADAKRMKFLCNTYVYLDVIARLTSTEDNGYVDLDQMLYLADRPFRNNEMEIDPLMGCATTLFPLMGKAASLIQRVRKTQVNGLNIIDEANSLRERLLDWNPPDHHLVEQPEDPNSNVHHAIHTAEAYRQAILLHLHQAVPELASEPSYVLAHNIMRTLAGVPLSSNTLIVQIYPLLVGSCEMVSLEDREFATKRWEAMMRRLSIVNVTSCWHIVREVWSRRDLHMQKQRLGLGPGSAPVRSRSQMQNFPPGLKRRTTGTEAVSDQDLIDIPQTDDTVFLEPEGRPPKRRLTFDVQSRPEFAHAGGRHPTSTSRRPGDGPILNIEPEYTVRGHLHWLAVMEDWRWEGKSTRWPCCLGASVTDTS